MDIIFPLPSFLVALFIALIPSVIVLASGRCKVPPSYPEDLPWSADKGWSVARIWTCLRGWPFLTKRLMQGYEKFNRFDRPFVYPNFALRPEIILPAKDLEWLIRLPDSLATPADNQNESLGLAHLFPTIRPVPGEKMIMGAIHTHCNRHTGLIQADIYDELRLSISREFGTDSSAWTEVPVAKAMANIMRDVGGRVVFGLPVCREQKWLTSAQRATNCFGAAMVAFRLSPWFIQPIISPILRAICDFTRMRCFKTIKPYFEIWHEKIMQEQRDGIHDPTVPYNLATSIMRALLKINDQHAVDVPLMFTTILLTALLPFNFSSLSSAATLFDIASSDPDQDVYEILRAEATTNIQSEEDWSTLASFANMPYTDSAVKESLRLNPSQARALNQTVVKESGLTLPSGQRVAKGTWLAVASMAIHLDDRFYPEAKTYKPFRFMKEDSGANAAEGSGGADANPTSKTKQQGQPDAHAPFLAFGAGRHRCSGQAFALHFNKMVVSYIVTHYDIEPLKSRPKNWEVADTVLPPQDAVVRVRRVSGHR